MKVLIAVDGSDSSSKAVQFVISRNWQKDDQFLVVSVVELVPVDVLVGFPGTVPSVSQQQHESCVAYARNAATSLRSAVPECHVVELTVSGIVAGTICQVAEAYDIDLIVVGSHGRKGLDHLLLGSVAEDVLKNSPCSVEVIKTKKNVSPNESNSSET